MMAQVPSHTNTGDLDGVPGSLLWSGPALASVVNLESQPEDERSLSFSLPFI